MVCCILLEIGSYYVCGLTCFIVYDAFEHWKQLVNLMCCAEDALSTHKDLFIAFIGNKNNIFLNAHYDHYYEVLCVQNKPQ